MVDLGGYVILLVKTKEERIKLLGSPADRADLEIGDEILEVNGKVVSACTHQEVINHIHECIRSRTICLRVKRRHKPCIEVGSDRIEEAYVIAAEDSAKAKLQKLVEQHRVRTFDITELSRCLDRGIQPTELTVSPTQISARFDSFATSFESSFEPQSLTPSATVGNRGISIADSAFFSSFDLVQSESGELRSERQSIQEELSKTKELIRAKRQEYFEQSTKTDSQTDSSRYSYFGRSVDEEWSNGVNGHGTSEESESDEDGHHEEAGDEFTALIQQEQSSTIVIIENGASQIRTTLSQPKPDASAALEPTVIVIPPLPAASSKASRPRYPAAAAMASIVEFPNSPPHHEMAVDVPDNFVGVTKQPPRYPPVLSALRAANLPDNSNNNANDASKKLKNGSGVNGALKIKTSEDIPDPKKSKTSKSKKPNHVNGDVTESALKPSTPDRESGRERIRRQVEEERMRREEEVRTFREQDILRSSIRGSKKLQALSQRGLQPEGQANAAFDDEISDDEPSATHLEYSSQGTLPLRKAPATPPQSEVLATPLPSANDLLEEIEKLQQQIHNSTDESSRDLELLKRFILSKPFHDALALHNEVVDTRVHYAKPVPVEAHSHQIAKEILLSTGVQSSPECAELAKVFETPEFSALLMSHDRIAAALEQQHSQSPVQEVPVEKIAAYGTDRLKVLRIIKGDDPLGATVRNDDDRVIVSRIVKGGVAEKTGLLKEGDEIVEVNNIELRGKTVNEVCDILATMTGPLTFLVIPAKDETLQPPDDKSRVMHVRAFFDYIPEDDIYIPCRELGLPFHKGDILHVISQEDANWWQAYRDGEQDTTLAGLIPSKSFQEQRLASQLAIVEGVEDSSMQGKKKSCKCGRARHRRKKKKLYDPSKTDLDSEEILTYEEVARLQPDPSRCRPVVLIGPPKIGRNDLRKMLMEAQSHLFDIAVPHTTRTRRDHEVESRDYHFVPRHVFEADIAAGKFVEHGEYERNLYGTSIESIRRVLSSSKMCVLNLYPQALRTLKRTNLQPFVIFIAAPNLERLRQMKSKQKENLRDTELLEIIEKSREIEDKYGHYFDAVITNIDMSEALTELQSIIDKVRREPTWVPAAWITSTT